jgi:hypothetical protein
MVLWKEQMKLSQIVEALEAKVLTGDDLLEKDIEYIEFRTCREGCLGLVGA